MLALVLRSPEFIKCNIYLFKAELQKVKGYGATNVVPQIIIVNRFSMIAKHIQE